MLLGEFFEYKNQLIGDMLTNPEIVKLVSDDISLVETPERLVYKQIFPFEYVPELVDNGKTFICCDVDIGSVTSKTFLEPVLYIWVFAHKSKLELPNGGVRTDQLCAEIAKTINGSRFYGLGELELRAAPRFTPIADYQGRELVFQARDFNRISPNKKSVPTNRKRG